MILKFFLIAILLCIIIFFINGLVPNSQPLGINLSVSENILPNLGIVIFDQFRNNISSIDENERFFPQQKGLSQGTVYGFRVIDKNGEVSMPVYETFTANSPDWTGWELGKQYYHGLRPGNYTVELLTIGNGFGIIVARINFSAFSLQAQRAEFENLIINRCGNLTNEPDIDADGWSREGKIGRCAAQVGAETGNVEACNALFKLFNDTGMGFGECIIYYANTTGNVSACNYAGMPKSVGFCRAKTLRDWTECRKVACDFSCAFESLEVQQELCVQWYAIETMNESLCSELKSETYNMKEICFNITSGNQ
jgi:hypothetical protein